MKKSSKIIIIVLSVVLVLGAIVGTLLFLFFKTDVLKSNNEVFFKYLSQNVERIKSFIINMFNMYFNYIAKYGKIQ